MGERLIVSLFKGIDQVHFQRTCDEVLSTLGLVGHREGELAKMRVLYGDSVQFSEQYHTFSWGISKLISMRSKCLFLSGYIQEGSLWECGLVKGNKHIGWFSTWPEYWDNKAPSKRETRAFAKQFAEAWGIPLERVERYLMSWGMKRISEGNPHKWMRTEHGVAMNFEDAPMAAPTLKGKAYPTDKHEYGSIWQLMDFLTAISGKDPQLLWEKPDKVIPVYFPSDEEFSRRYKEVLKNWFGDGGP